MTESAENEHNDKKSALLEKEASANNTQLSYRRKTFAKQMLIAAIIFLAVIAVLLCGFIYFIIKLNPTAASR